jgi:hypothetical protein
LQIYSYTSFKACAMSAIKSDGCSIPIDSLMQPFAIGRGEADMAGIGYAPCRTTVAEDIERGIDSLSDGQQSLFISHWQPRSLTSNGRRWQN